MSLIPTRGKFVLYDTEFTSWEGFLEQKFQAPGRYREIIQIGAVKLDAGVGSDLNEVESFCCLVRPKINSDLSDYIQDLTGISQKNLDQNAVTFAQALDSFVAFIGDDTDMLLSFGRDGEVIVENCDINGVDHPAVLPPEENLRQYMLKIGLLEDYVFSADLPTVFGIDVDFTSHDALGDARAVASVVRHLRGAGKL
tara:strand:- start:12160 stop:12750 length:591 start_codon:yes stop_codon:yes gene_type:complete